MPNHTKLSQLELWHSAKPSQKMATAQVWTITDEPLYVAISSMLVDFLSGKSSGEADSQEITRGQNMHDLVSCKKKKHPLAFQPMDAFFFG